MPEPNAIRTFLEIFYTLVPPFFYQMLQVVAAAANSILEALGVTGFGVTAF